MKSRPGVPAIRWIAGASALASLAIAAACSSSVGGPVLGPVDDHCYLAADGGVPGGPESVQPTSEASCHPDAGAADAGPSGPTYGPTMYNSAANDDDCKYQVGWWSTPIQQGSDVTFYVSVIKTADGTPLSGGASSTRAEVFLNDHHPAPNSHQASSEETADGGQGVYAIGPVRFDASGIWTVRFHFREDCEDLFSDSPHGHAAFFVQVP